MNEEGFIEILGEDIETATKINNTTHAEEFLAYATGMLISGEEFDDFVECYFEGLSSRNGKIAINGYAMNETDGSCCLFIVDYHDKNMSDSIKSEEINSAFKKLRLFVEESVRKEFYSEMRGSEQAIDFSRDLYYESESITKYRFYFLTNAYNRQRVRTMKDTEIAGKTVELNVWDISRIYDLACSKTQKENVEIEVEDFGYNGIPCVKAVEYYDVVADIEMERENVDENNIGGNKITYTSYLAVVQGKLLNDLYLEYGTKLLEGNVRSFLSVRGKVNKSIQNTIKNYPEMFFAYNNGIAATATEIETEMTSEGLVIKKISNLQIVNGGQTTASIANTLLSAKKGEVINLDKLSVPMKVSVLEPAVSEKIIPKISEYSNSQNKVEASDFFSNHPFHIRMEGYSRKIAIPSIGGNQFQQYWFYERTRGQYNQGKMKFNARSSQLKQYSLRYPENQVIKMLDLARYMMIYDCHPDVVSKGKQKTLQIFADKIRKSWNQSDEKFNALYYKRVVSLSIIYTITDNIVKNSDWYKEKRSYKANITAYTLCVIFNYIKERKRGYDIDFSRIWNSQNTYEELEDQIRITAKEVYEYITGPRLTENVTEWCKKEICWTRAKSQIWTINDGFLYSLVSKDMLNNEVKEERSKRKLENEIDSINEIYTKGVQYWQSVLEWGSARRLVSEKEVSILKLIINMNITGRVPTDKQAKVLMQTKNRLIKEGMPLQF